MKIRLAYIPLVLAGFVVLPGCEQKIEFTCNDDCVAGERHCIDNFSYEICDNYDSDSCFEFSAEPYKCPTGSICVDGYCVKKGESCEYGSKRCDGEVNGYQVCKFVDSVLKYSDVQLCTAGTYCRNGECSTCQNQCVSGFKRCTEDNKGIEQCAIDVASGCLVWQPLAPCNGNDVCSAGNCSAPEKCQDDCQAGMAICSGDGFRPCGQYDEDPCLDFGPIEECPRGEFCSNGSCSAQCVNECSAEGVRECYLGGFRVCANVDSDPCLEWSYSQCALDESCSFGECKPYSECLSECESSTCTADGNAILPCGQFDADSCLDLGPAEKCLENFVCEDGECICSCDYISNVCEPDSYHSAFSCTCDPDCQFAEKCIADGYCDPWCVPTTDPDCRGECSCDMTTFCDAYCDFQDGSGCGVPTANNLSCSCDPECSNGRRACVRDGFVDDFCPRTGTFADPDVGKAACANYSIDGGYLLANDSRIKYTGTVNDEGNGWMELSTSLFNTGSMEFDFSFASDNRSCMSNVKIGVYGYDTCSCIFGAEGAEIYYYNNLTNTYDLQPGSVTNNKEWTYYTTNKLANYLKCDDNYCSLQVKIASGICQCSHINKITYTINMDR